MVLQEAQIMGLPVISTFHNGIPESILVNETGILVPERDIEALAEKIEYLVNNQLLREEMGKKGIDFVTQRFDNKKLVGNLCETYRKVLDD